jgi:hypothetical protein
LGRVCVCVCALRSAKGLPSSPQIAHLVVVLVRPATGPGRRASRAGPVDQRVVDQCVAEGAPTEEPRPDASNAR